MSLLHRLASIASWILHRNRAERRLDDEIETFVAMSAAEKMRDGVPAAEARWLALLELGGMEQVKERVRSGRHGAVLDDIGRDVHHALRLLVRQRTFTVVTGLFIVVAVITCAVGFANYKLSRVSSQQTDQLTHRNLPALQTLAKLEGILPALESAHAVAYAQRMARELGPKAILLVNLSGRGDKDVNTVEKALANA